MSIKWRHKPGSGMYQARAGGVVYIVRKRSPGGMVRGMGWEVCTGWPSQRVYVSYYLSDCKAWVQQQAEAAACAS